MENKEKTAQNVLQETQQALQILVREQEEMIATLKSRLGTTSS